MKLLKKALFGIGSLATVVAPLAGVVSCGAKKVTFGGSGVGGTLSLGMRTEDFDKWKTVLNEFGQATGIKIVPKTIAAGVDSALRNWAIGDKVPDVTLAGSSFIEEADNSGWFESMDLHDLMTNPKYSDYNSKLSKEFQMDTNADFDAAHFDLNAAEKVRTPEEAIDSTSPTHMMLPTIKGMAAFYAWTQYSDKAATPIFKAEADRATAPAIKWFVPNGTGDVAEVTDFNSGDPSTSPLFYTDADGHKKQYKLIKEDVQRFIFAAGFESQKKFNLNTKAHANETLSQALARITLNITGGSNLYNDAKDAVLSTGTFGMLQRIYAVQRAIYDNQPTDNPTFLKPKAIGKNANIFAPITEYNTFFDNNVNPYIKLGKYNDQPRSHEANYQQDLFPKNTSGKAVKIDKANPSDLAKLLYLTEGLNRIDKTLNAQEDIAHKKIMMVDGAKWKYKEFEAAKERANLTKINGGMTAFAVPFSSVSVEGYAIRRGMDKTQKTLAKKLIRFLAQPRVQAIISNNNAVPISVKASEQMESIYGPKTYIDKAFEKMGKPTTEKGTLPAGEQALTSPHIKFFNSISSSKGRLARWSAQAAESQYSIEAGYVTPQAMIDKLYGMSTHFWNNENVSGV